MRALKGLRLPETLRAVCTRTSMYLEHHNERCGTFGFRFFVRPLRSPWIACPRPHVLPLQADGARHSLPQNWLCRCKGGGWRTSQTRIENQDSGSRQRVGKHRNSCVGSQAPRVLCSERAVGPAVPEVVRGRPAHGRCGSIHLWSPSCAVSHRDSRDSSDGCCDPLLQRGHASLSRSFCKGGCELLVQSFIKISRNASDTANVTVVHTISIEPQFSAKVCTFRYSAGL